MLVNVTLRDNSNPDRPTFLIDTSFEIETGETVVVGTSRLDGNRALLLLVTSVAQEVNRASFSGAWVYVSPPGPVEMIELNPGQHPLVKSPATVPSLGYKFEFRQSDQSINIEREFNGRSIIVSMDAKGSDTANVELGQSTIWSAHWEGPKLVILTRAKGAQAQSGEVRRVLSLESDGSLRIETTGLVGRPPQANVYRRPPG